MALTNAAKMLALSADMPFSINKDRPYPPISHARDKEQKQRTMMTLIQDPGLRSAISGLVAVFVLVPLFEFPHIQIPGPIRARSTNVRATKIRAHLPKFLIRIFFENEV